MNMAALLAVRMLHVKCVQCALMVRGTHRANRTLKTNEIDRSVRFHFGWYFIGFHVPLANANATSRTPRLHGEE